MVRTRSMNMKSSATSSKHSEPPNIIIPATPPMNHNKRGGENENRINEFP